MISNDAGETDIVDFQYFVFNLLALAYFLGSFVPDLRNGLRELPELLVALTGASAATYVTKKAIEREKPSITALLPSKARAGRDIEIWGHSLLLGERSSESRKPRISIGSAEVPDSDLLILGDAASGVDHLRCTVPRTAELGAGTLRIVTVAGVCAEAPLEIESGVRVRAVTPGKVKIASPAEITIVGGGFGAPDTQGVVLLDGVTLATQAWAEDVIRVTLADPGAYAPNQQAQLMVQDGAGQRSEPWILGVE